MGPEFFRQSNFFSLKLNRKASVIFKAFKYDPRRRQRENGLWQPYLCENIWHARVVSAPHAAIFLELTPLTHLCCILIFLFFFLLKEKHFFKIELVKA